MTRFDIDKFCDKHNLIKQDYGEYSQFYDNSKIYTVLSNDVPFMLIDTGISVYMIRWCRFTELMMDRNSVFKVAGYEGDPLDNCYYQK